MSPFLVNSSIRGLLFSLLVCACGFPPGKVLAQEDKAKHSHHVDEEERERREKAKKERHEERQRKLDQLHELHRTEESILKSNAEADERESDNASISEGGNLKSGNPSGNSTPAERSLSVSSSPSKGTVNGDGPIPTQGNPENDYLAVHVKEEKKHVTVLQIKASTHILESAGATKDEVRGVKRAADRAQASGDDRDLAKASDDMTSLGGKYEVKSSVQIVTAKDGAAIKFQTYGERLRAQPAHTANGLTTAKIQVDIGVYYIWAERNGLATSDASDFYTLTDLEPQPIILNER